METHKKGERWNKKMQKPAEKSRSVEENSQDNIQ